MNIMNIQPFILMHVCPQINLKFIFYQVFKGVIKNLFENQALDIASNICYIIAKRYYIVRY